jgi:DNA-binding FadR family transcriptional regulator
MDRVVDRAADQLRRDVLSGRVPPGTRLPPERTLCDTLGVSRLTLRAAIARLEGEGLLSARRGSGVTVSDWRRTADLGILPYLVELEGGTLVSDLLALRRSVAADAIAAASTRATEAELDELSAFADALASESDPEALAEGNLEFSRQVVALAGNTPALLLLNTVVRIARERPELSRVLAGDVPAIQASFPAVVALLRARDPERARTSVRTLLEMLDGRSTLSDGAAVGDAGSHRAEKEGPK